MTRIKKMLGLGGTLVVCLATAGCSNVSAGCSTLPKSVSTYVTANAGWSVVSLADLPRDDQDLWHQYHKDLCPGVAELKLYGPADKSIAIALIKKSNGQILEKLVLLSGIKSPSVPEEIVPATSVTTPFVVWKTRPGIYKDQDTSTNVHIANESIIYEKMESTSTQFYVEDGKLKSLLASE